LVHWVDCAEAGVIGSHRIVLPATVEVVFGAGFVPIASKQIAGD
jgi:hypothetical protein